MEGGLGRREGREGGRGGREGGEGERVHSTLHIPNSQFHHFKFTNTFLQQKISPCTIV